MIDERYIIMIHKHLRQELSEADQLSLQHWLDQSPDHQRAFSDMEKAWKLSGGYLADYTPDVESGLQKLKQRIREENAPAPEIPRSAKRFRLSFTSAIAAALLFLIAALAVWNFWFRPVEMLLVSTGMGEQKTIPLEDGSSIVLNENSELSYPRFFQGKREVNLSGEAFFEVAHDAGRSFIISTLKTKTEVLGTSFNLRAYEDEGFTEVEVVEGIVRLADFEGKAPLELKQGFRGTYDHQTKTLLPDRPKALNAHYWKERRLRFKEHLLSEAITEMETRLGLNIQLTNTALANCALTLAIPIDQPGDKIIAVIADIYNASWKGTADGGFLISGGDCQLD